MHGHDTIGRSPAVGSITSPAQRGARQRGSGLLEVMVALLLTSVGLLGLIQTQRAATHPTVTATASGGLALRTRGASAGGIASTLVSHAAGVAVYA